MNENIDSKKTTKTKSNQSQKPNKTRAYKQHTNKKTSEVSADKCISTGGIDDWLKCYTICIRPINEFNGHQPPSPNVTIDWERNSWKLWVRISCNSFDELRHYESWKSANIVITSAGSSWTNPSILVVEHSYRALRSHSIHLPRQFFSCKTTVFK